jgi:exonuclease III
LTIIHSGGEKRGNKGVAIILRGKWKNNVLNTFHVNERIIMIKLQAQPTDMYIIQVYFLKTSCKEEEIEIMYQQLEKLLRITDNKSNVFVIGDFNASVGSQITGHECVGKFRLGNTNER